MVFEHPALYDLADVLDGANGAPEPGDAHHAPMTASGLSPDELAALTTSWSVSNDGAR
jgi:mycobactin peptide synthetase MbtE